ncbi:unnamed protein product [Cuscuta epithymum]|uniref:Uncharacterized protein n=1 Tax=Cuscuta epithymum TaxID=186058 RepID=A0AAV0EBY6_9ASTE|nr:unnamed protein product [Cuscuta epithymum]
MAAMKLVFSRLPGGGYVQLREGYSNLDLLAAVSVADSEMERNRCNNNSLLHPPPPQKKKTSSVVPRNKRSSRRRISDSVLKCVVSAFKKLSIGGGPTGNNQKIRSAARKISRKRVHPQPAAGEAGPMPGRFRDGIRQLAGPDAEIAEENLLMEKEITASDLSLTAEEEMRLATSQDKKVGSLDDVALIATIGGDVVKSEVSLRRCGRRAGKPACHSSSPARGTKFRKVSV